MNKAVTLVLALLLLSGISWASTAASAVPPTGVRVTEQPVESPPMPVAPQDAVLLTQDFNGTWTTGPPPTGWTITYTGSGPDNNDWHKYSNMARLFFYT